MSLILLTYVIYIPVTIAITVWVGQTLFINGRLFLVDVFANEELANSVNHLLIMGFYLFNFGYIALQMQVSSPPTSVSGLLEALAGKIGVVLMVLAVLHLGNVFVLAQWRKRTLSPKATPPPMYYNPYPPRQEFAIPATDDNATPQQ